MIYRSGGQAFLPAISISALKRKLFATALQSIDRIVVVPPESGELQSRSGDEIVADITGRDEAQAFFKAAEIEAGLDLPCR